MQMCVQRQRAYVALDYLSTISVFYTHFWVIKIIKTVYILIYIYKKILKQQPSKTQPFLLHRRHFLIIHPLPHSPLLSLWNN